MKGTIHFEVKEVNDIQSSVEIDIDLKDVDIIDRRILVFDLIKALQMDKKEISQLVKTLMTKGVDAYNESTEFNHYPEESSVLEVREDA